MSSQPGERRVDASMSLLAELAATSLDPGYARAHERGDDRGDDGGAGTRSRGLLLLTLALAGFLIGTAVVVNHRATPAATREREHVIAQVKAEQATHEALRQQLTGVEQEVENLQADVLGPDSSPAEKRQTLAAQAGASRVKGPGVVVTVDDSSTLGGGAGAEVVDQDLRMLVNGLWASGAEAIAVNGHRVSARTAIRGAGRAITVDYTSLTRPYVVQAIGDPKVLPGALAASAGGQWWVFLNQNYGMRFDISTAATLTLEPDPGLRLTKAGAVR